MSRSGRTVKRNAFHDEIAEQEQHLRAVKQETSKSTTPKSASSSKSPSEAGSEKADSDVPDPEITPLAPSTSQLVDTVPGMAAMSAASAAGSTLAPPYLGSSATAATGGSASVADSVPPRVLDPLLDDSKDSKTPRRKPGARECMQISRRFGADVINDKYMEILLDYCKRGKAEHLIRMRERLDDHARYLESQLAALEVMAQQKGDDAAAAAPPQDTAVASAAPAPPAPVAKLAPAVTVPPSASVATAAAVAPKSPPKEAPPPSASTTS